MLGLLPTMRLRHWLAALPGGALRLTQRDALAIQELHHIFKSLDGAIGLAGYAAQYLPKVARFDVGLLLQRPSALNVSR